MLRFMEPGLQSKADALLGFHPKRCGLQKRKCAVQQSPEAYGGICGFRFAVQCCGCLVDQLPEGGVARARLVRVARAVNHRGIEVRLSLRKAEIGGGERGDTVRGAEFLLTFTPFEIALHRGVHARCSEVGERVFKVGAAGEVVVERIRRDTNVGGEEAQRESWEAVLP